MPNRHVFAYMNASPIAHTLHLLLFFPFSLPYSKQRLLIYCSRGESQLRCAQLLREPVFANSLMVSLLSALSVYFVFQGKKFPG